MPEVIREANPGSVSDTQKERQGKRRSSGLPSRELCPLRELGGQEEAGGEGHVLRLCDWQGCLIAWAQCSLGLSGLSGPPSWVLLSHHDDSWMMLGT